MKESMDIRSYSNNMNKICIKNMVGKGSPPTLEPLVEEFTLTIAFPYGLALISLNWNSYFYFI